MSWLERLLNVEARIGPGRLVLVVGPSGAGKDTLIRAVQEACRGDREVVFPRRVVTRAGSADEDHDTLSEPAFERAVASGAFALLWSAHGLRYGIPSAIDTELQAGHTIVCNVSRTVVAAARERYVQVTVVLVTAPREVLVQRLAARGRAADGDLGARVARSEAVGRDLAPDVIIENVGSVDCGARKLMEAIRPPVHAVWL
jgi:ribose 1,5-bisphosphokinase